MTAEDLILSKTIKKWFAIFEAMNPGQAIEVSEVAKRDPKLFIDLAKCFIDGNPETHEFSNCYKYFKRVA